MKNINTLFETRTSDDYQRDNFDHFLKKISFKYSVPSIHVAGSNGKGSVCYYLSNIYLKNGYKVGRFISPCLNQINECISVNNENISDEDIVRIIDSEKKLINKNNLSSFEVLTFVAFSYFMEQKCDIAIIECGMGGEVDATNVFDPILSVITSVSMEHTAYLGKSISEIAEQKAGIIKDFIPVEVGHLDEDALNIIAAIAKDKRCDISQVGLTGSQSLTTEGYKFDYLTYSDVRVKSLANYSVDDACIALDCIELLKEQFPCQKEKNYEGLFDISIPARFEVFKKKKSIVVDGAHNPESMLKLTKSLQLLPQNGEIGVVFACFKDKNLNSMLASIGEVADKLYLTTFNHPRARDKDDYFLYAEEYPFISDPLEALKTLEEDENISTIVITGSLAFAGYMRELLK